MDPVASILFGKTRQAVLAQLFSFPEERIYLRELARRTGISSGALQAELNQLLSADLVRREKDGNRVLYSANKASPVFEELHGLVLKTAGVPALIRTALEPLHAQLDLVLIYGSIAKGTASAASDVDLLAVGSASLQDILGALATLEARIGREINVRVFGAHEFDQRRKDNDRFITGVLNGPTIHIFGTFDDTR